MDSPNTDDHAVSGSGLNVSNEVGFLDFFDYYLIFCIYLLPSYFLGLVKPRWFFWGWSDYSIFVFLCSIGLFFYPANKYAEKVPGFTFIKIICLYIVLQTVISFFFYQIPVYELASTLRGNIFHPFVCWAILYAFGSRPVSKLRLIMKIIPVLFLIHLVQFAISALWGIDICLTPRAVNKEFIQESTESIRANMNLFPGQMNFFLMLLAIVFLDKKNVKWFLVLLLLIIVHLFSGIRNIAAKFILQFIILIVLLTFYYRKTLNLGIVFRIVTLLILSAVLFMGTSFLIESQINRTFQRWDLSQYSDINLSEHISYSFRKGLYESSHEEISSSDAQYIFGKGYRKDYDLVPGRPLYSIVLGVDNMTAGLLYCEGYFGILLRIMPYLMLLLWSLKHFFSSDASADKSLFVEEYCPNAQLISVISIVIISGECLCYVFTTALARMQFTYGMLGILIIYYYKVTESNEQIEIL